MKKKVITPELRLKLRRIKEFLDGEGIGSVISGDQVVYRLDGHEQRTRSLFETKRLVQRSQQA
jgi:hypothetical protein